MLPGCQVVWIKRKLNWCSWHPFLLYFISFGSRSLDLSFHHTLSIHHVYVRGKTREKNKALKDTDGFWERNLSERYDYLSFYQWLEESVGNIFSRYQQRAVLDDGEFLEADGFCVLLNIECSLWLQVLTLYHTVLVSEGIKLKFSLSQWTESIAKLSQLCLLLFMFPRHKCWMAEKLRSGDKSPANCSQYNTHVSG